ncbi:hypothetical protein D3C78_1744710 [compost metagenome]
MRSGRHPGRRTSSVDDGAPLPGSAITGDVRHQVQETDPVERYGERQYTAARKALFLCDFWHMPLVRLSRSGLVSTIYLRLQLVC